MKLTTLEVRMLNILRKNPVVGAAKQYKAALNRLCVKGLARCSGDTWTLSTKSLVRERL